MFSLNSAIFYLFLLIHSTILILLSCSSSEIKIHSSEYNFVWFLYLSSAPVCCWRILSSDLSLAGPGPSLALLSPACFFIFFSNLSCLVYYPILLVLSCLILCTFPVLFIILSSLSYPIYFQAQF